MKYIKEKPAKAEPRVFESAKRMPKGVVRKAMHSADSRTEAKSAEHSDPIKQANDKSVDGAIDGGKETAKQVGDSAKVIQQHFKKARYAKAAKATRSAAKRSVSNIKTASAAAKAAKRGIQAANRAFIESIRASIRAAQIAIKATIAAAKATAAAVKGLVALIAAGGWVAVVIIAAVAVIGWLFASPLSILMTGNEGQSKTIQSIMAELVQETADEIEQIREQQGTDREVLLTYEGSEDGSIIQNGAEVIAVYSVRVSMDESNPSEAIIIDDYNEQILRDTYHRMVQISYQIITSENTTESGGPTNGETETLEITINCKSYNEMITDLKFTTDQIQMLHELMQPDYITLYQSMIGISLPGGLSAAEMAQIKASLPSDLLLVQQDIVDSALSLIGKVHYFWGGKSTVIGWDNRWGSPMEVTAPGSSTTGTIRPFGLDCSGFVAWVYVNAGVPAGKIADVFGTNTSDQWKYSVPVSWNEAQIGDLAFFAVPGTSKYNHVGVVVSIDSTGHYQVAHCASSRNDVVIGLAAESGFQYIRRPIICR
ncbi:MAG: NlpC/P60 family protein [Clostridiaceae bacterium]|nr:NlpC/P60 family protein [Clostridiaceae bacterium]